MSVSTRGELPGRELSCDVMVMGSGMAGMAAALFASQRGLSVVQAGALGGIDFSTGLIDLMAVHPVAEKKLWDDPFAAIAALVADEPDHPYARLDPGTIRAALAGFTAFLASVGQPYQGIEGKNVSMLTPMGTRKRTYLVPASMWPGVQALKDKAPCLVVDFPGFKGYSGCQIAQTAAAFWPGVRSVSVAFPGHHGELYAEHLARSLEKAEVRLRLAREIKAHLDGEEIVALPAILGVSRVGEVVADLERLLGLAVFEIPTLPPSMAGYRLRAAFEDNFDRERVRVLSQQLVKAATPAGDGGFVLSVGGERAETTVRARAVVMACGRFFGKGLAATREKALEPVFGLPVVQPEGRTAWHHERFFHPGGHPINRAGLAVDGSLRPLGESGGPAHPALFAAGSILAHQDWMRSKCGAGLAVSTAYRAVEQIARTLTPGS